MTFFVNEREDRQRLPVAIVSGFLGSGKTTLLNQLLRDPRMAETAVAMNEFGAVPLDHQLIDHGADKTVVMANGCLCCSLAGDMEDAVMRVFSRGADGSLPRFRRLIVEPSGLADPAPIAQAVLRNPAMARVLRLDGIVTVIDALFGTRQLAAEEVLSRQAALADHLVLTKTDLAEPAATERLRDQLAGLNPVAPVHVARHGVLDPRLLFSPHFLDPQQAAPTYAMPASATRGLRIATSPAAHGAAVLATVLTAREKLPWARLELWLRRKRIAFADSLLRLKGIADIAGSDRPLVLHGVHHVLHTPVHLDAWPGGERRTQIVMITRGVTEAAVRDGWTGLTAAPELA